jgi:hypothetical protein
MIEKFGNAFCVKMCGVIREIDLTCGVTSKKKKDKNGKNDKNHFKAYDSIKSAKKTPPKIA